MTKTKTAKAKAAAAANTKAQLASDSKKTPTAPTPSGAKGLPSKSSNIPQAVKAKTQKVEPIRGKSTNVEPTKHKSQKAKQTKDSIKQALFGCAELNPMLKAAAADFYNSYGGFHSPPIAEDKRFDLLCKTHSWNVKNMSKHADRFLALALAKDSPGLLDCVFENNFGHSYLVTFGKPEKRSVSCSAKARFEAVAVRQHWPEGGKLYKRHWEVFRSRFFHDCAIEIKAHPGDSKVLLLLKDIKLARMTISTNMNNDSSDSLASSSSYSLINDRDTSPEVMSYNDSAKNPAPDTLALQFEQLAIRNQWTQGSKQYRKQRGEFYAGRFKEEWSEIAYTSDEGDDEDDNSHRGVDISKVLKLAQWQNICNELGVDPVPNTIKQCSKALKGINVNIYDFLEARHTNNKQGDGTVLVRRFPTVRALARYSSAAGKIYPKERAKRAGALKNLLHVFA